MRLSTTLIATLAALAFGGNALAASPEELVTAGKCHSCHKASSSKEAPTWASIAAKYKDKPEMVDKLVAMLKTGVPLSGKTDPDDQHKKVAASDADLKGLVHFVLATK
jgi:cytochrome c551/c552